MMNTNNELTNGFELSFLPMRPRSRQRRNGPLWNAYAARFSISISGWSGKAANSLLRLMGREGVKQFIKSEFQL